MRSCAACAAVIALLSACGRAPQGPSPGEQAVLWVDIEGPQTVPLDASVSFRLLGRLSDGSHRDLTRAAVWNTNEYLSFSEPGVATTRQSGVTKVSARYDTFTGTKSVVVLASGTFRMYGRVREAGTAEGWLSGAHVEVVSGVGAGQSANTGWWGDYHLFGVVGAIRLLVTKHGYEPTTHEVTVDGDGPPTRVVEMPLTAPRADVSGIYSLTIAAADECGRGLGDQHLPEEVRLRSYTANVRQEGPTVRVDLGATTGTFEGKVDPAEDVVFVIPWYDGEAPNVRELIPGSRTLVVRGTTATPVASDRLTGMLSGWIQVFDGNDYWSPPVAECFSERHQFALTR